MNYILILIIILLICVIVGLWKYKKKPIIMLKYKEFTLDNMSSKAILLNNFYAIAWNKINKFQTDSILLKRDGETGKYIIKDVNATCIEGKYIGVSCYFNEVDEIYMTKNDLINKDLQ